MPLPSATTSPTEEVEEEGAEEVQAEEPATTDHVSEAPTRKRRRVARVVFSFTSSPAKESDVKDDGDSGSSPTAIAAPLNVSPLSLAPPPQLGEELLFGGPNFDNLDTDEEEEHRFAPELFALKFLLVDICAYVVFLLSLAALRPCIL